MAPEGYARLRIAGCDEALRRLGASTERKIDLRTSEIENYRRFTHVAHGGPLRARALEYFRHEAWRVEQQVRAADLPTACSCSPGRAATRSTTCSTP